MNEEFLYGQLLAWTPTSQRLPPDGIPVLVTIGGEYEVLTWWEEVTEGDDRHEAHWTAAIGGWWTGPEPSYWMPLPPLRPNVAWSPVERKPPGW